jgi:hypothetical protein
MIYTIGSKSNSGVGAAYLMVKGYQELNKAKFKLHKNCSVFQSELIAIIKALNFV